MDPFGHQRKVMQVTGSIDLRMTLHDRVVARHPNDLDLDRIGWLAGKNNVGDQAAQEFFFSSAAIWSLCQSSGREAEIVRSCSRNSSGIAEIAGVCTKRS